ncbi:MAG: methionyl-tRNA formyltransferase [Clostridiales bacterium]|jgi:methionyl-tRNA formyltransferase|nr:methionyl-tRNA formyltransferase [Clostridiales bacterium]
MGTPEFATPSLNALLREHDVAAVVTRADKPKGRGKKISYSSVKLAAMEHGLTALQPKSFKDEGFLERLIAFRADAFVVTAYGRILPKAALEAPKYGCVNVHPSLLPKYRGASPIHSAIINGEKKTGVSVMRLDEGMDTGDVISRDEIIIENDDTYGSLHDRLAVLGAKALLAALSLIERGEARFEKQNDAEATYSTLITPDTGRLDWRKDAREIVNLIRGVTPSPGAKVTFKGETLKIIAARAEEDASCGAPGEIIAVTSEGICVQAKTGRVVITKLQPPGKKPMEALAYVNGHSVGAGEFFD